MFDETVGGRRRVLWPPEPGRPQMLQKGHPRAMPLLHWLVQCRRTHGGVPDARWFHGGDRDGSAVLNDGAFIILPNNCKLNNVWWKYTQIWESRLIEETSLPSTSSCAWPEHQHRVLCSYICKLKSNEKNLIGQNWVYKEIIKQQ